MDSTPTDSENSNLHFLDYWRVIRSRKEIILAVTLLVTLTGAAVTTILPKKYKSVCRIKVQEDAPDVRVFSGGRTPSYNPYFLLTEQELIRSSMILGTVVDNLDLTRRWAERYGVEGAPLPRDVAVLILSKNIGVSQQRNTSNIEITAVSEESDEAARLANEIAEAYRQHRLAAKRREVMAGIAALEGEMKRREKEVEAAEEEVERIREEEGITLYANQITAEEEKVRRLQADLMQYRVDMLTREARLREIESLEGAQLVDVLLMNFPNAHLQQLRSQLSDSEINLNMLLENLGQQHPDVRRVRAGVDDLQTKMNNTIDGIKAGIRTDYKVSKAKHDALLGELKKYEEQEILAKSAKVLPYERAQRDLRQKRSILVALQARVAQEGIEIDVPRTPVQVFEVAQPATKHFSPRYVVNLVLSVFVGLVFGVGLAYFIEYLDTSVKTVDDIERYLGVPVVGVIPQKVKPLNQEGPESPHMEAYRVLRTNLQFANKGLGGGAFAVCSSGVGEGKSTTLFNLAYVCAMMGDKVLIVDSDMRRPVQHTILGMSNRFGLTNVLMRDVPIEETIKTTSEPNLHFLPSGRLPRSSVGFLDTQRVRDLIKNLKARYDYVFFDSPPIMGVSDASIIASEVDGVLMVVQYRKYPRVMSARAKRLVENVGGNIVGVVLNNINILRDDYYYYYHSYYSHYSEPDAVVDDADMENEEVERPKERF